MANFSRSSAFSAYQHLLGQIRTHAEFQDLMYKWELDHLAEQTTGGLAPRVQAAFRWLKDNQDSKHNGEFYIDLFVKEALARNPSPELLRSIELDGYTIEDGLLRRTLPEVADLPAADDEVHRLLCVYGLNTPLGHLDRAIVAHTQGNWASANSQCRTFYEALFDEIASIVDPQEGATIKTGETRRQFLANSSPPFISRDLNEWSDDGKNFVNGVLKRLHSQGSHPGLSDEEDSTFRLHLVLLTARLFLRRLDSTQSRL